MRLLRPDEVVAFLQNPWFRPGTFDETVRMYRENVEFRRRLLARSMSGGRLLRAFGEDWFGKIWWDNANPLHGNDHSARWLADTYHMSDVVTTRCPLVVLTFGRIAANGAAKIRLSRVIRVLSCAHPNAMGITQDDLDVFANRVMSITVDQ